VTDTARELNLRLLESTWNCVHVGAAHIRCLPFSDGSDAVVNIGMKLASRRRFNAALLLSRDDVESLIAMLTAALERSHKRGA
jgi:hypothetical protein